VPIPPLDQRVLHPAEYGVAVEPAGWQLQVVDDIKHRHREDGCDVEPDRHVEGRLVPAGQRPEEVDRKHHPHQRHKDVQRPDQLRIFLSLSIAKRERQCRSENGQLPAPEVNATEQI